MCLFVLKWRKDSAVRSYDNVVGPWNTKITCSQTKLKSNVCLFVQYFGYHFFFGCARSAPKISVFWYSIVEKLCNLWMWIKWFTKTLVSQTKMDLPFLSFLPISLVSHVHFMKIKKRETRDIHACSFFQIACHNYVRCTLISHLGEISAPSMYI